jgi:Zn-dependent protease
VLAVFNMLPLPPLDGGRVAVGLLPDILARPLAALEPFGMLILVGVLFLVPLLGEQLGLDLSVVSRLVGVVAGTIISGILGLTGNA